MKATEFAAKVRRDTRTDSTTFTDSDILAMMNEEAIEIAKMIEQVNEDYFGVIDTRNLKPTATSRFYLLPSDWLQRFKRVEAKLADKWQILYETDINLLDFPISDEEEILKHFPSVKGRNYYDVFGENLILLTCEVPETVTNGLVLYGYAYPNAVTSLATTNDLSRPESEDPDNNTLIGMPRLIHNMWAERVVIKWKGQQQKPIPLNETEQKHNERMEKVISLFKGATRDRMDNELPAEDDGSNHGYEY